MSVATGKQIDYACQMIRSHRFMSVALQLLFVACFMLAGILSASASTHGGMAGATAFAIHEGAGIDSQNHKGHHAHASGQAKLDYHSENVPGEKGQTGSCCEAACFMAMVLKCTPLLHVQPKNSYAPAGNVRLAG